MKKIILKAKAIIFDMDGVITNTMPYHFYAWKEILALRGIKVSAQDIYKREGQPGLQTIKEIFCEYQRCISVRERKRLLRQKERLFRARVKRKFIPGAKPLLHYLKRHKFLLGMVTGTSRKEVKKILPRYIYNIFDVIITGDEVKRGKPYPEPFLKALSRLNVAAKHAIIIENAPFGIRAAKKAGIFCIALETSLPKKYLLQADMVFKDIPDLKNKVCFIDNSPSV